MKPSKDATACIITIATQVILLRRVFRPSDGADNHAADALSLILWSFVPERHQGDQPTGL
jgi:hypothetical protein